MGFRNFVSTAIALVSLGLLLAALVLVFRAPPSRRMDATGPPSGPALARVAPREMDRSFLTDVTGEAGLDFRHYAGVQGRLWNPETFGPGAGFVDVDGDGRLDIVCVNGNNLEGPLDPSHTLALYRNEGGGRFREATREAGLAVPCYGMGFLAADLDNDGDQDLLVYGHRALLLFMNDGTGRFTEESARRGLSDQGKWYGTAAVLDYDRDGWLDLFAGSYVEWSREREDTADCRFGTARKRYCPVALFPATSPRLLRNAGGGLFEDVSAPAGLATLKGKALGAYPVDVNRDGFPDLVVADDSVPNLLLVNQGNGTFVERGMESGLALDAQGAALAGMGIAGAWLPDDGPLVIAIGNFSGEPTTFHVQRETEFFVDRSFENGIGAETLSRVTFGVLLEDLDLDGELDLLLANGHVFDIEEITGVAYRQPPQLFLGTAPGEFAPVRARDAGDVLNRPLIGRALARGDFDGDGDQDVLLTENQGPALLLRNDTPRKRALRLSLRGTRSNRDAAGAEAWVRMGARRERRQVEGGSSYMAQSERSLTFALRSGETVEEVRVEWPSGGSEVFDLPRDAARGEAAGTHLLVEGSGRAVPDPRSRRTGSPPEAAPGLEARTRSDPANPVLWGLLGTERFQAGRYAEADQALARAVLLRPADFVSWRFRLMAASRLGDPGALRARALEAARSFPDADLLESHFAVVLRETGYAEAARLVDEEVVRLAPRRSDVWMALGNYHFDRGEHQAALERYLRALALRPDAVDVLANAGKARLVLGEMGPALELLERALGADPDHVGSLSALGGALLKLGRLDEAERRLLRAVEVLRARGKDDETVHGNLGILYLKRKDYARAKECFERVLALKPGDPKTLEYLNRIGSLSSRIRGTSES